MKTRQLAVTTLVVGLCAGPVFAASNPKKPVATAAKKPGKQPAKEPEKRAATKDASELKLNLPHTSWNLGSGGRLLDATDISLGGNGGKAKPAEKKNDKADKAAAPKPKAVKKP